ncbi:MAG: HAMP domain-containing protein [Proteobacteria bacterium]|nr:HAMP domain-containing protein [Pseudomonadota bacterium]MBU1739256.1 HAMP domain-containing protein [Pseudomonadota bacterium]
MKITHKILLGFTLTVLLAALICIGGLVHLEEVSGQYDRQVMINAPVIESLHEILVAGLRIVAASAEVRMLQEHAHQQGGELRNSIIEGELKELREGYREIYDYHEKYYGLVHKYFPGKSTQQEEVSAAVERLVNSSVNLVDPKNQETSLEILELKEELEEADDVFMKVLNRVILEEEKEQDGEQALLVASCTGVKSILIGLTFLAAFGAVLSVFLILSSFRSGIAALGEASEKIAKGDFALNFDEKRNDEFGVLANDFKKMAEEISSARNIADWSLLKMEKYAADLKAKSREYEEFVFIASHDLQEPLRKIMSYASRVRKGIAGKVEEEYEDYVTKAIELSAYLREKLDILSAYSRINANEEGFAKVALNEIVTSVVERFRSNYGGGDVAFELDTLPVIDGKSDLLAKMFHCLLDNSFKYRGDIPLEIRVAADVLEQENYCRIVFEDNGKGFEQKYAGKIFRVFHSLDDKKIGGLGMGLAIVKKIVEVHGGSISAESTPGNGARFILVFPIRQTGRNSIFSAMEAG